MPGSARILVVDSDSVSQGEVQKLLVSRRYVVLGGTDLGEESVAMARAFQPEVVLLNLDDGHGSHALIDQMASALPEARLLAYSRRKGTDSTTQRAQIAFGERPVRIVSTSEKALLAAIESALTGLEEPEPITVEGDRQETGTAPPVAPPRQEEPGRGWVAPLREGANPFLRHFAGVASEWLLTRSPQAEKSLMATLAEDVQAPSFGGHGRDAVRRGLEGIAWRLGGDFRLVLSEVDAGPVLMAVVATKDGRWHRAGHFVVRAGDGSTVSYLDYRDDETSGDGERPPDGG